MARFLRRNSGSRQRVSRRKRLTPEPHVKAAYWLVPLVPGCEVEGSSAGISVEGASVPCGAVGVLLPPLSGAGGTAPCCCCIGSVDSLPACCSSQAVRPRASAAAATVGKSEACLIAYQHHPKKRTGES